MGCVQTVEFGEVAGDSAAARLEDFVCREFLNRAHWTYPDGFPGGFGVEQSLYKTQAGDYGRFTGDLRQGCVAWRELGTRYASVPLTGQLPAFAPQFSPVSNRS